MFFKRELFGIYSGRSDADGPMLMVRCRWSDADGAYGGADGELRQLCAFEA